HMRPRSLPTRVPPDLACDLPGPDDADVFVDRLARAGLLVHDPVAAAALRGDVAGVSTRTVERRVARATGLTRSAIRQIERAGRADRKSTRLNSSHGKI